MLTAKHMGSFFKMAAELVGQVARAQVNYSGDSELDQKIAEWLSLDQVNRRISDTTHACYSGNSNELGRL